MTSSSNVILPTADDIAAAAERLRQFIIPTPLLEHPLLSKKLGFRLFVKAECLQPTGAFKFRGATNKLRRLEEARRLPQTVVAFSSGNHAQAVAAACALLEIPAVIVMPADAPAVKKEATQSWGAEVVTYDRWTEDRVAIGQQIAKERNAILVPPYDDFDVICGQGSCAVEVLDQLTDRGVRIGGFAVPCGGGGLTAGCATYLKSAVPSARCYAVEPEGWDDTRRSLEQGTRLRNAGTGGPLCDALLSPLPGEMTFPLQQRANVAPIVVGEADIKNAMKTAFELFHLSVEPGGAVAFAAVLSGQIQPQSTSDAVVAILSGGNVDPHQFAEILTKTHED